MKKRVEFVIESPEECTDEEFREWIYFELGVSGSIQTKNPLSSHQLEVDDVIIDPAW